jgi:hypothetical protein
MTQTDLLGELSTRRLTVVELPIRIVSEMNLREHWRSRHRRFQSQKTDFVWSMVGHHPQSKRARITLTRLAPRKLDDDNLAAGFKAIRDAVADWIGVDDGSTSLTWVYRQEQVSKRYAIRLEVEWKV